MSDSIVYNVMINPATGMFVRFDGTVWRDAKGVVVNIPRGRTIEFPEEGDVAGTGNSSGFPLMLTETGLAKIAAAAGTARAVMPMVNGDLPGPGFLTDPHGQCIAVPI